MEQKTDISETELLSAEACPTPYEDLYIYYIQGHPGFCEDVCGQHFIGNWEEDEFSFLFFSQPSPENVENLLRMYPNLILLDQYHMTYDEWQGGKFSSFQVGRFFISPPWDTGKKIKSPHSAFQIILDPGVVFGTGTHPTTHDCLEMLELAYAGQKIRTVLDIGTGTGLLAIAAARLGCEKVLAVDLNFLAVKTAYRNFTLNHLNDRICAVRGKAEDFMDCPAELVIANIHYDVMKDLIVSDGFLAKKQFILSGLLRSQAREISNQLSRLPVCILKEQTSDGIWHTFFGKII